VVDDWSDKASENSSTNDEGGGGMEADSDAGASASSKPKKPTKTQNVAAIRKNHLNIVFIGHVGTFLSPHWLIWCWLNHLLCSSVHLP